MIRLDEGEPVPASGADFCGLGFMGGPMSANDKLSWTEPVLSLMRDAVKNRVPVIGHCLGGQLFSRALGGRVTRNPVKEIGWVSVEVDDSALARDWLAGARRFESFQWHEETFTLPSGAERILSGRTCENQAYVLDDLHLGMQCHIEMDAEMIDTWCHTGREEIAESLACSPSVQDAATIRGLMARNLPALTGIADRLYERWIQGLKR